MVLAEVDSAADQIALESKADVARVRKTTVARNTMWTIDPDDLCIIGGKRLPANAKVTLRSGDVFGFIGPNGAGKTTAMRIILGVLAPDAGQVRWSRHR